MSSKILCVPNSERCTVVLDVDIGLFIQGGGKIVPSGSSELGNMALNKTPYPLTNHFKMYFLLTLNYFFSPRAYKQKQSLKYVNSVPEFSFLCSPATRVHIDPS